MKNPALVMEKTEKMLEMAKGRRHPLLGTTTTMTATELVAMVMMMTTPTPKESSHQGSA